MQISESSAKQLVQVLEKALEVISHSLIPGRLAVNVPAIVKVLRGLRDELRQSLGDKE